MSLGPDKWGPSFWKTLHVTCLAQTATADFVREYANVIPCQTCAQDFKEILNQNPFPNLPENAFEWSVNVHNMVNMKLDKKVLTPQEAYNALTASSSSSSQIIILVIIIWLVAFFLGTLLR